jgi:ubiquinone/menaquinone biosynthesis C-methylase UbiE
MDDRQWCGMNEASPLILPTREGYDRWSQVYDSDGNPLIALEEPQVEALLGDVRNLTLLDIGCGTGRHAIRLARAGAQVTAIDFSTGMLEQARHKQGADAIRFQQHDLSAPLPFADESFDRVLCALVLDHIASLSSFFTEMHRVCRSGGFAVISVMHPAMTLRGVQARFHDSATFQEIRPESVANQFSDYVMAAIRANFTIDHLSEHAVDESLAAQLPRAQRYISWPMLLMVRLIPQK